jgi:hypothetical protein
MFPTKDSANLPPLASSMHPKFLPLDHKGKGGLYKGLFEKKWSKFGTFSRISLFFEYYQI